MLIGRLTELGKSGGSWQRIMNFLREAQMPAPHGANADVLILPCGTMEEAKAGVEALCDSVPMSGSMAADGPDAKRSKVSRKRPPVSPRCGGSLKNYQLDGISEIYTGLT